MNAIDKCHIYIANSGSEYQTVSMICAFRKVDNEDFLKLNFEVLVPLIMR
jgi:hypothetical protein